MVFFSSDLTFQNIPLLKDVKVFPFYSVLSNTTHKNIKEKKILFNWKRQCCPHKEAQLINAVKSVCVRVNA